MLADGINPAPGLNFLGSPGVALQNVAVATFTIADSSGSPGTKWDAKIAWGDGNTDKNSPATAGPNGTFQFLDSHTYASPGTFTITVMIAVPGSHDPSANTVTTKAVITSASLQSIAVTPANPTVAPGKTEQFTATGTLSDNSTVNLTNFATWASATTAVATISNDTTGTQGLATAVATGTSNIDAEVNGITGSTLLTVHAAVLQSIAVTPATPSVPLGKTEQFTATGTYTDGSTQNLTSQVTWASATTSVATISNIAGSQGLASTLATGTTAITAALSGVTSPSDTLTVAAAALQSIAVAPVTPSVAKGLTEQFTATGTYTDGSTQNLTNQVTWVSGTTSVATISNTAGSQGLASTLATGTTAITAALSGVTSPADTLTVSAATLTSIAVAPVNPSVAKGLTEQFTATGTYTDGSTQILTGQVTWASGTTSVATISNTAGSQGLASTLATGTTAVTAALSGVTSPSDTLTVIAAALQSIAVAPANPSVAKGLTEQFTATGTYTDGSTQDLTSQVTWASATTSVATISNTSDTQGLAAALTIGTSTISASLDGIADSTALTVTAAALESILVSPANPTLPKGETEQFSAMGTYSDQSTQNLTNQVAWGSATTSVATITSAGLATGVTTGTSTISAALSGITGSTVLTVSPAALLSIVVTPDTPFVPSSSTEQFTATGTFSDQSTEDLTSQVTWASATTSVATISNAAGSQGLATTVSQGTSTISAAFDGISGSTVLTVRPVALLSIAVTPASPSVPKGETQQFSAMGTYSDESTQDLTSQVTWASATTSVATITSAGLAAGLATGTSNISAALNGITGSTVLTVSPAALLSIALTPASPTVPKGETQQFSAIGTYSDHSTHDLTSQVTWSSATSSVANISSAASSQGLATAISTGISTIGANLGGVSSSTVLTVSAAVLQSIALTAAKPSIAQGTTEQFTATGTFSDQSTQDLTTQVIWASATPSVTTISNASGSQGFATTLAKGTSSISATLDGITGATLLTVTAVLESIAVTTANSTLSTGATEQFTATGTFSDGSTEDLSAQATWASSNTAWATINAGGLATAGSPGAVTISATFDGITGSTGLTVVTPKITPTQTVIIGEQPLFARKLNKKGKPAGKAVLSGFTLDFSVPLNAASASNPANYQLDTVTTKRVKKKIKTTLHSITRFTLSYVTASDAIEIKLGAKETFPTGGQLTVLGGVATNSGGTLSGPTVFTIFKGGKRISPS